MSGAAATLQAFGGAAQRSHYPTPSEDGRGGEREGGDGVEQQVIAGAELEKLRTVHFMMYHHVQLLQQHIRELHESFEPEVTHLILLTPPSLSLSHTRAHSHTLPVSRTLLSERFESLEPTSPHLETTPSPSGGDSHLCFLCVSCVCVSCVCVLMLLTLTEKAPTQARPTFEFASALQCCTRRCASRRSSTSRSES